MLKRPLLASSSQELDVKFSACSEAGPPRMPGVPQCHARMPGVLPWRFSVAFLRSVLAFLRGILECHARMPDGVLAWRSGFLAWLFQPLDVFAC